MAEDGNGVLRLGPDEDVDADDGVLAAAVLEVQREVVLERRRRLGDLNEVDLLRRRTEDDGGRLVAVLDRSAESAPKSWYDLQMYTPQHPINYTA